MVQVATTARNFPIFPKQSSCFDWNVVTRLPPRAPRLDMIERRLPALRRRVSPWACLVGRWHDPPQAPLRWAPRGWAVLSKLAFHRAPRSDMIERRLPACGCRAPWPDPDGRRHGPLRAHAEVSRSRAVLGTQKGGGPKDLALSLEGSGPEDHAAVA